MKKLWIVLLATSRTVLFAIAGIAVLLGLMLYQLTTLTPGFSEAEISTLQSANSISDISENMVNAPYKTAIFISTHIFEVEFGLRFVNAMIGVLAVIIFYFMVSWIFGSVIALSTTAMFATSTLLLAMSRVATPHIMLLSLMSIIATGAYLRFGKRSDIGWILTAVVLGLSLYVPGMIIFIAAAAIWQFKRVKKSFESLRTPIIITSSAIFGALCVPLFISLVRDISLWRGYLGLPEDLASLTIMFKYAVASFMSMFVMSPADSNHWLGRQPVLDIFATAMFILGVYTLVKQYKLDRLWTLIGIFIISALWIGLTTNRYGVILVLPFVYMVVGSGISLLIGRWSSIFPKNPIAKYAGSALMFIAIVLSINFQLHRYFVAWANNDATKQNFSHQLTEVSQ